MSQTPVHTDISRLLEILRATGKKYDLDKITRAFEYAREMHEGQMRVSGEPYISHPVGYRFDLRRAAARYGRGLLG